MSYDDYNEYRGRAIDGLGSYTGEDNITKAQAWATLALAAAIHDGLYSVAMAVKSAES